MPLKKRKSPATNSVATRTPKTKEEFVFGISQSSRGAVLVALSDFGIVAVMTGDDAERLPIRLQEHFRKTALRQDARRVKTALAALIGLIEDPTAKLDLPVDIRGTEFQRRIWQAVRKIPVGETATYAEIARIAGKPRAMRAVGTACTHNPLSYAVPCHRVTHSGGTLVERLARGSARKRAWIEREIAVVTGKDAKPKKRIT